VVRGHGPIVKALLRACEGQVGTGRGSCLTRYGRTELRTVR
jgi:hypothetical protein